MHSSLCRGLAAAFALLTLAPSAQAIVITQSHTYSFAGASFGGPVIEGFWGFAPFAAYTGVPPLVSVSLTLGLDGTASVSEHNPFDSALLHIPGVHVQLTGVAAGLGFSPTATFSGPAVSIAPHAHTLFTTALSGQWTEMWTTPQNLALFTGAPPQMFSLTTVRGLARYGGYSASGNVTVTLAYDNGVPAPDTGSSAALLTLALGVMSLAVHRLRAPIGPRRAGL